MDRRGPAHNPDRAEEPWVGRSTDEYVALREQLDELTTRVVADGLVGTLAGGRTFDELSSRTAATYRALLREVGVPGRRPGHRRTAAARGSRGFAETRVLTGAAGMGGIVALAAAGAPLAAVAVLSPIILDTPAFDAQNAAQSACGVDRPDFGPEGGRVVRFDRSADAHRTRVAEAWACAARAQAV